MIICTTVLEGPGTVIGRAGDRGLPTAPQFQAIPGDATFHTGEARERYWTSRGVTSPSVQATVHAAPICGGDERVLLIAAFGMRK